MSDNSVFDKPGEATRDDALTESSSGRKPSASEEPPIHFRDVTPVIEFVCWVVVALAPFLRWINGPAVTDDQFTIQVTLVGLALAGAIGLRIYNWRVGQSQRE